jgi:CBS domain-containing protein
VAPELSASALAAEMGKPGAATRRMVVREGRLLGVISLRDLSEYVALKLELDSPARR